MKIFVVDDEIRQRQSIIRHVDWNRYEMRVTGEAEDAAEALALAELDPPDLLITDIRLLGMSGLELSSRMRVYNPKLRIIMVTGYEQFEYAKTALDLGVDAFLVKPIDFGKLAAILEQMHGERLIDMRKTEEEARVKDQLKSFALIARENLMQELIHGLLLHESEAAERARSLGMFTDAVPRSIAIVSIDFIPHPSHTKEAATRIAQAAIRRSADKACASHIEETTVTPRGDLVLFVKQGKSLIGDRMMTLLLEEIESEAGTIGLSSICIGVGPPAESLVGLSESYRLARRAVNLRLLGRTEQIFFWHEFIDQPEHSGKSLQESSNEFFERMGAGDSLGSRSALGDLMRGLLGDIRIRGSEMRSLCLEWVSRASRTADEIGGAGKHLGSEKQLWGELLECEDEMELLQTTIRILTGFCDYIADKNLSHAQVIVRKALDMMNARYKENLSLSSVADAVFLSPNYLGALLREELGQSFTDLLIHIRIAQAKQLLHHSELKLYEVAESVGYQNIGYFTGLFKRITGLSPKEYRNFVGAADDE